MSNKSNMDNSTHVVINSIVIVQHHCDKDISEQGKRINYIKVISAISAIISTIIGLLSILGEPSSLTNGIDKLLSFFS